MFVLCVPYSKDKRQSQDNQDKEVQLKYREREREREIPPWHECFVLRGKLQDNKEKETTRCNDK